MKRKNAHGVVGDAKLGTGTGSEAGTEAGTETGAAGSGVGAGAEPFRQHDHKQCPGSKDSIFANA